MRAGGRILMIFGVVLGIIAAAATFIILRETTPAPGSDGTAPIIESRTVIVAVQNIEPYQEIPLDAIQPREYPEPLPDNAVLGEMPAEIVEGATEPGLPISGVEFVAGKLSNTRIYPGQVIVATQLVDKSLEEQRLGLGSDLSYIVPDGQVAMALPIDQISSVAGALRAGDQVDIIATVNVPDEGSTSEETGTAVTQFLLQKVQILRVGPWTIQDDAQQQDPAAVGGIVTVIVDPQQALELKRIRESANWEFVLRSITDDSDFATDPVDDLYLIEQYNIRP